MNTKRRWRLTKLVMIPSEKLDDLLEFMLKLEKRIEYLEEEHAKVHNILVRHLSETVIASQQVSAFGQKALEDLVTE